MNTEFLYNQKYRDVVREAKLGFLPLREAAEKLGAIEEAAYEAIPDAEPDGDITYGAACAYEEIENHFSQEVAERDSNR